MTIKLSPTLPDPGTTYNGLVPMHRTLVDAKGSDRFLCLVEIRALRNSEEKTNGAMTPTVQITKIEPIPPGFLHEGVHADLINAEELVRVMQALHEERTGKVPIPGV